MPLVDYTKDTRNRILVGGASAAGLIIAAVAGVSMLTPAYQVRDSNGQVTWQVNLGGQSTQSGVIASKTLANCNTIDGTSTGMLVCGTDDGGSSGGGGAWSGTGALQTYFDPRYVNTSGDTMTGKLLINLTTGTDALEVVQTASASKLHANTLLTVSGSVVVEDNVTVDGLMSFVGYSASPQLTAADTTSGLHFDGPGVVSIHNGGIQTMLLSSTNNVGIGIGSPETKLEVEGTVSGTNLYGLQSVQSSGSLIVEGLTTLHGNIEMDGGDINDLGNVTFKTGAVGGVLRTGTSNADKFQLQGYDVNDGVYRNVFEVDAGNDVTFEFNNDNADVDFHAEGVTDQSLFYIDASADEIGVGTNTPKSKFEVIGTMSGRTVYATRSFSGAGLTDCDTAGTSKLLWDATAGRFSCGTDTDTNTTYLAAQGLTLNGTSFSLTPSHSGTTIWATTALRSSGALTWEGAGSGATLYLGGQFEGVGLTDCDAATQTIAWDATTKRFSCGTDSDTTYTAGQGLTLTSTSFRLTAAHSGSVITATTTLASSGTLVVEGAMSGASLFVGTSLRGSGLTDCDTAGTSKLLWDTTTGRFSCGTDTDTNTTYTAGQGLTLSSTSFRTNATLSGVTIWATTALRSSGSLVWEGAGSGQALNLAGGNILVSSTGSFIWNETGYNVDMRWEGDTDANLLYLDASADRIGIGTRTPDTKLDVVGTISGSLLKGTTVSGSVIRSDYAVSPVKFQIPLTTTGGTMTTGSGKTKVIIDRTMSGYKLGDVFFGVDKAGVTNTTCIHLRDRNKGNRKLLSTPACIDSTESGTTTAATPYAINASNADVGAYDYLYVDVSTVSTTAPKGAVVILYFYKP